MEKVEEERPEGQEGVLAWTKAKQVKHSVKELKKFRANEDNKNPLRCQKKKRIRHQNK